MAGNTVVSLVFYDKLENTNHFFQFEANSLDFPVLDGGRTFDTDVIFETDSIMDLRELANQFGTPIDHVVESFLEVVGDEIELEVSPVLRASAAETSDVNIPQRNIEDFDVTSFSEPAEAVEIRNLIELTRQGPISLTPMGRQLPPAIPQWLYSSGTGWSHGNTNWRSIAGGHEIVFYSVHRDTNPWTGNIFNHAMQGVFTGRNLHNNQQRISFVVSHNTWVLWERFSNRISVQNRTAAELMEVNPVIFIETNDLRGRFVSYRIDAIRSTSSVSNIFSAVMHFAPVQVGAFWTALNERAGGTQTDNVLHHTTPNTKILTARINMLTRPQNHLTLTVDSMELQWFNFNFTYGLGLRW
jgi:hypothetical protein